MRTIGIDLSSSAERTAFVKLEWADREALVGEPALGLEDDELAQRLIDGDWVGVDAPFGWPASMSDALSEYSTAGCWPPTTSDEFRFRRTDRFVRERLLAETGCRYLPTSVSASRASLTARRLAKLRERFFAYSGFRFDRAGADRIVEVQVRATLSLWGLPRSPYKTSRIARAREVEQLARERLVLALDQAVPWLVWSPGSRERCIQSDDALDAVFAALVARAAALEMTYAPPAEDTELVRREGWVHLPRSMSLVHLLGGK